MGKSLTNPPTNLKDAIDWIALVGAGYGSTSLDQGKRTALKSALDKLLSWSSLRSQLKINVELDGLILKLANGLGPGFLGYNATTTISGSSGIAQSGYQSTYRDAQGPSGAENDCAKVFLAAASMVFYGLSFLYLQCKMSHGGWKDSQLTDTGSWGLGKFMRDMGFQANTLRIIQGSAVASRLAADGTYTFDELKTAYGNGQYIYSNFVDRLVQQQQSNALNYPLTNCHKIATHYFQSVFKNSETNDNTLQKIKQAFQTFKGSCGNYHRDFTEEISGFINSSMTLTPSLGSTTSSSQSSPAGPVAGTLTMFGLGGGAAAAYLLNLGGTKTLVNGLLRIDLSYDCPSNPKQAIDWILRVAGKDGQSGGNDGTASLAKAVKKLLEEVKGVDTGLGKEFEHVIGALGNGQSGLIGKLAEGLQQFIGYEKGSNGLIRLNGVGRANDPLERLRDAVLGFWLGALMQVSGLLSGQKNAEDKKKVDVVVSSIIGAFGRGKEGVKGVADSVNKLDVTGHNVHGVNEILTALKADINDLRTNLSSSELNSLGVAVEKYLKAVLRKVEKDADTANSEVGNLKIHLPAVVTALKSQTNKPIDLGDSGIKTQLDAVNGNQNGSNTQLGNLIKKGEIGDAKAKNIVNAVCPEPKAFVNIMTDKSRMFNGNKSATDVVSKAFEKFKEFSTAASGQSYAEFLNKFKNKGLTTWQGSSKPTDSNFLSGLYLCSTSYFRHQHQKKAAQARPPSSIREMLYWLMGLTATPQFGDLLGHIHNVVGDYFKVAVSGSSKKDETLSADQVTSYILSTCYTAPSVLDIIQGRVPPNGSKDEPWLHRLYSNADFNYTYPSSGAALFYALSNYTYALQFQLGFLYQQCSQLYVNTCGWFMCTYGKGVNPIGSNGKVVSSHICPVGCSNPNHTSDDYNSHKSTYCQHAECGTSASKPSPLQAFLTDNLKGFSRGHPSGHSDHLAACSSHTCHVPMGFESHIRADGKYQGGHISPTLKGFCGSSNTPLCHLSETLTCLSKRTPRTLGDLFGFLWHLNGQLFHNTRPTLQALAKKLVDAIGKNNSPKVPGFLFNILKNVAQSLPSSGPSPSGLSLSLESMAPTIPFLYQLFMLKEEYFLPTKLYDLNGSTHQHSHKDLYSISACRNGPNENCGEYLSPLCYSTGSAFAPHHASSYFSWVLYLTDDLETGLQEMLDEFKNIDW
ncbi:variant erythrocyte surface antigen-1 family protein [Babesia caballi]|uniref:Variant erythrocyte surface antigen-1 family protein n=1 Tax=Babesia caballi TaxID=5871 RepID=A0AAV4M0Q7_BABCB|nr:variant erythrocyte surface antigen-1 family protein [Babesia caballi]